MTRILVVDGSHLMCLLVDHLAPRHVLVEQATSFVEAQVALANDPPHAAVFNITPCNLEWKLLIELCMHHNPPIPFFCCTSLPTDHDLLVGLPCDEEGVFTKPFPIGELKLCLRELIDRAPHLDTESHARQNQLQ